MKRKLLTTVGLTLALAAPAYAADAPPTSSTSGTAEASERPAVAPIPRGTALGSRAEEARYAAREAASPDAKKYRGGDVIVISATAIAIILLVVIIIILI